MSAFARLLRDASEPATWTGEERQRSWVARVFYPALDTPVWLALLLLASIVIAGVGAVVADVANRSYLRLVGAVLIFGYTGVTYGRRVGVILRHRR